MDAGGFDLTLITVVGVVALGIVIALAMLRNRSARSTAKESEDATRRLYEEEDREHHAESDQVP